jgi:zinc D-Ala-D-Ala carboxypeptidase
MKNISTNLTYGAAVMSATAKKYGLPNIPSEAELENMYHVADTVFEPLRKGLGGKPIFVSCFYRAPKVNTLAGGSKTSQHRLGEAMDLDGDVFASPSNREIFDYIRKHLEFDQLIAEGIEGGKIAWVHVSKKKKGANRKDIKFMYRNAKGEAIYESFTEKRYKELVYGA